MKKLKSMIIILIILTILILLLIVFLNNKNIDKVENNIVDNQEKNIIERIDVLEVKNPHMYFTVKSCIEKYMNYVQGNDIESVYKILDSKYIQDKSITKENVMKYVENVKNPISLSIEEMKYIEIDENNQEYYVLGTMTEETVDDSIKGVTEKICITVKIDKENMIYSIIPFGYGGPMYEKR